MKEIVFEDSIVLYWDKEWEAVGTPTYAVYLDGAPACRTEKTHATLYGLTPERDYAVRVVRILGGEELTILDTCLHTPAARRRIDVTQPPYSALGDGKTLNTRALQAAIDDCRAGETVYLPRGVYLTGALDLHSDMELYVDAGATLQGVDDEGAYLPKIKSRFEGWEMDCYRALLNVGKMDSAGGYTCGNIVLRGGGSILGGGRALSESMTRAERARLLAGGTSEEECAAAAPRARGRLIGICNADGVTVEGLSLGFGAAWNVHFVYSRNIVTCNGSIVSDGVPNGDGWDPDSSEDCTVFHMDFHTGDDAIAIKSGKNPEGNRIARPTRGIRIFDCRGKDGIAIGSELSGGVEDVAIWDSDMQHPLSRRGFRIKTTKKRGGYVRSVRVKDSKFAQIVIYTLYGCNDDGESAEGQELTDISDISLLGVESSGKVAHWEGEGYVENAPCLQISGFDERYIRGLLLKNVSCRARGDRFRQKIQIEKTEGLVIENLTVTED